MARTIVLSLFLLQGTVQCVGYERCWPSTSAAVVDGDGLAANCCRQVGDWRALPRRMTPPLCRAPVSPASVSRMSSQDWKLPLAPQARRARTICPGKYRRGDGTCIPQIPYHAWIHTRIDALKSAIRFRTIAILHSGDATSQTVFAPSWPHHRMTPVFVRGPPDSLSDVRQSGEQICNRLWRGIIPGALCALPCLKGIVSGHLQHKKDHIMRFGHRQTGAVEEMVAEIDCKTGEPIIRERPILEQFCYEGGYTLALTDLASQGVKVEILHPDEGSRAVILPSDEVERCAQWILCALALGRGSLVAELAAILERLMQSKDSRLSIRQSDKKRLREAMTIMRRC